MITLWSLSPLDWSCPRRDDKRKRRYSASLLVGLDSPDDLQKIFEKLRKQH